MELKKMLGMTLIAVLGGASALGISKAFEKSNEPKSFDEKQKVAFTSSGKVAAQPGVDFTATSAAVTPAVVHIKTSVDLSGFEQKEMPGQKPDFFEFFGPDFKFDMPNQPHGGGSGSGVIISHDGYIATNNHVVEGATTIEVVLQDKRSFRAEVIGTDPSTDLALIKVGEENLPFLKFGNSDATKIGEWVLAVGNPFNLTSTVTAGIVSAKGRNINLLHTGEGGNYAVENFIQTDAAVNPGNSGGALVNLSGELIGINTAIASNTGSYSGYSFAIPVNIVRKVMDDFLKYGEVQRGFLGIEIRDVDAKLAEEKNLGVVKGVYVNKVNENSAAAVAGIKAGDVIVKVGDAEVNSSSSLQEQVAKYYPGYKIAITVLRNGKEQVFSAILKSKDGSTEIGKKETVKEGAASLLGIEMQNLTKEDKVKVKNGVRVSIKSAGPFKDAGIPDGFIITHIDKKPVYTISEVKSLLGAKTGGVLIEGVSPSGKNEVYGIKIDG